MTQEELKVLKDAYLELCRQADSQAEFTEEELTDITIVDKVIIERLREVIAKSERKIMCNKWEYKDGFFIKGNEFACSQKLTDKDEEFILEKINHYNLQDGRSVYSYLVGYLGTKCEFLEQEVARLKGK